VRRIEDIGEIGFDAERRPFTERGVFCDREVPIINAWPACVADAAITESVWRWRRKTTRIEPHWSTRFGIGTLEHVIFAELLDELLLS
jgi:hypothetical protein